MNKFYGKIGFVRTVETAPDVWADDSKESYYYGDVVKNSRSYQSAEGLNDNFLVTNTISILADDYAYNHSHEMRYIEYLGVLWKITSIDIQRPRIKITMGGVYNA